MSQRTKLLQETSDQLWSAREGLLMYSRTDARQVSRMWVKEQVRLIDKVRGEVIAQLARGAQ